jgi:hypothetical protein
MFKGFIESRSPSFARFCLVVLIVFVAGREVERWVLSGSRVGAEADGMSAVVDGLGTAGWVAGWSSDAKVRVAAGVTGGLALALARMQAGMGAIP